MHFILVQFLTFALGSASLLNLVGLGYALLLNREFKGKGAARLMVFIILIPVLISWQLTAVKEEGMR